MLSVKNIGLLGYRVRARASTSWTSWGSRTRSPRVSSSTAVGRPGHEKDLPGEWVVARFTAPEALPRAALTPDSQRRVLDARAALQCGPLQHLLHAVEGPLGWQEVARNLRTAARLTAIRLPRTPLRRVSSCAARRRRRSVTRLVQLAPEPVATCAWTASAACRNPPPGRWSRGRAAGSGGGPAASRPGSLPEPTPVSAPPGERPPTARSMMAGRRQEGTHASEDAGEADRQADTDGPWRWMDRPPALRAARRAPPRPTGAAGWQDGVFAPLGRFFELGRWPGATGTT